MRKAIAPTKSSVYARNFSTRETPLADGGPFPRAARSVACAGTTGRACVAVPVEPVGGTWTVVTAPPSLLPLPGTPGRGLGRGARCAWSRSPFDSQIRGGSANRARRDVARRSPLSPALSPEYREEGVARFARSSRLQPLVIHQLLRPPEDQDRQPQQNQKQHPRQR